MLFLKRSYIFLYLLSFGIFALSAGYLLIAFSYQHEIEYFVIGIVLFMLFAVLNKFSAKEITCKDGYNVVQAYMFYRKCVAKGFDKKPEKISQHDLVEIKKLTENLDYAEGFTSAQIKELYTNGYNAKKIRSNKK